MPPRLPPPLGALALVNIVGWAAPHLFFPVIGWPWQWVLLITPVIGLALALLGIWALWRRVRQQMQTLRQSQSTAEQALHETSQLLETVFATTPTLIAYLDQDFNFVRVNRAYAEADGRPVDFFAGRNHFDLYPHAENEAIFRRVVATGEPYAVYAKSFEYPESPEHGVTYWDWTLAPVPGPDGNIAAVILSLLNVTERVRAVEASRESHAILQSIFDNGHVLMGVSEVLSEDDGRYIACNTAVAQTLGSTPEAISGRLFSELNVPLAIRRLWVEHYQQSLRTGQPATFEYQRVVAGSQRWYMATLRVISPPRCSYVTLDITERKHAELVLRESEARFRYLVENSFDIISILEADATVRYESPAHERILGYTLDEMVGRPAMELVHPDDLPELVKILVEGMTQANYLTRFEYRIQHKDGSWRVLESFAINRLEDPAIHGLIINSRDITERRRMEAQLRESETRFRHIAEHMPLLLDAFADDDRLLLWNHECERVTGYTAAEMVGNPCALEKLYPDPAYRARQMAAWANQKNDYRNIEWEATCKDGQKRIIAWSSISQSVPIPGWATWGVGVDVTQRKQAETKLRETLSILDSIFSAEQVLMGVIEVVSDDEARYISVNSAVARFLGQPIEQIEGRLLSEVGVPEAIRRLWVSHYQISTRMGQEISFEYERATPTGQRWFLAAVRAINPPRYSFVMQDITARKQMEAQLLASVREKEVLVKEVHHRVKNNLQVMISLLNLQADRISDPAALAVFRDSRERVRTMALVHEKLYQSTDLAHIHFGDYLTDLTHNLQLIYGLPGQVTAQVEADPIWLSIDTAIPCGLLANELISNAFKYAFPVGRAGTVRVRLQARPPAAGAARQLCLQVSDDGVGLPPDLHPAQTETLGMQLAHILTKQLGGTLTVSGPPGVTFEIVFSERKEERL